MATEGKDDTASGEPKSKVQVDDRGRSVWADPVESGNFDLISTQDLRRIIDSGDDENMRAIEAVAASDEDGVVVRNSSTGMFRVIDENELQAMLANDRKRPNDVSPPDVGLEPVRPQTDGDDELSLLSTQALRQIIKSEQSVPAPKSKPGEHKIGGELDDLPDRGGGFNPYDSG